MREEGTEMAGSSDLNDDAFLASLVHPQTSLLLKVIKKTTLIALYISKF